MCEGVKICSEQMYYFYYILYIIIIIIISSIISGGISSINIIINIIIKKELSASLHLTITPPHWVPVRGIEDTVHIHPTSVPGSMVPVQCHLHTQIDFGLISVEVTSILPH